MAANQWTYGKEGTAWPVRAGQIWAVGPHFFICSDLMDSDLLDRAVATVTLLPTLLYSDPPWNQGNINSFRTKAGLHRAHHSHLDLYRRISSLAARYTIPAYIEGGNREASAVQDVLPFPQFTRTWGIQYYRKHPCTLHYSGPGPSPVVGIDGMDDEDTPLAVMRAHGPSGVVLDPCAGRGVTSRRAHAAGWTSISNELHPNRMSAALSRMHKGTGHVPQLVQDGA